MPEISNCPSCKRPVSIPERLIGRTVRCPSCKSKFIAKSIFGEAEAVEEESERLQNDAEGQPGKSANIHEREENEDYAPDQAPFRDAIVHGWQQVRIGLILVVAGFSVAIIAALLLTLSANSDAPAVQRMRLFQGGRGEQWVKETVAALVCTFSGGSIDDASSRTSLWVLSLVGIGIAVILTAVGDGFCMRVPKNHRARATAMGGLVISVMGYAVFLGGCIWSFMEFEAVRGFASGNKTAPPSFGMMAGILGFTLLLSQPLLFTFFLRAAALKAEYKTFTGFLTFGLVVGTIGFVAYLANVIGLYWVLRDMMETMAGSKVEGGTEMLGTVGGISAIVAFFTSLTFALWNIAAILITRITIARYIDRIQGDTRFAAALRAAR